MFACGLAWFGSLSGLKAETLASAPDLPAQSAEPFALATTPLAAGSLQDKWLGLQRRLDDDMPDFTGKLKEEDIPKLQAFIQGTADAIRPK